MTLLQIYRRIKQIALAHKQVRAYKRGLVGDYLADKTSKYMAVFLQETGGAISVKNKAATFSFTIFFLDLVHVSEGTNENTEDVLSDTVSVAQDIIAQLSSPVFNDWKFDGADALRLLEETENDMVAGCSLNFSISVIFKQDRCQIPSSLIESLPNDDTMKIIYDTIYVATGDEGSELTIPEISGKKVLLITKESSVLYKVSSNPDPAEYTISGSAITLGSPVTVGQRFLILYRNI